MKQALPTHIQRTIDLISRTFQKELLPYKKIKLTKRDRKELSEWLAASEENRELFQNATNPQQMGKIISFLRIEYLFVNVKLEKLKSKLQFTDAHISSMTPVRRLMYSRIAAAALFIVAIVISFFLVQRKKQIDETYADSRRQAGTVTTAVADKGLTVADHNPSNTKEKIDNTTKREFGKVYSVLDTVDGIVYKTVRTTHGTTYTLALPDQTIVWLNTVSSIRFPLTFNEKERVVNVSGEAYLEVAPLYLPSDNPGKKEKMPFLAYIDNQDIAAEVLGTHFNINAYTDEPQARITLLEGSVQVTRKNKLNGTKDILAKLSPADEAVIKRNGKTEVLQGIDSTKTMAWKDNVFNFKNTEFEEVMRQISRWYDIEIEYIDSILPRNSKIEINENFGGTLNRDNPLNSLLEAIDQAKPNVAFQLREKKLLITRLITK